MSLFDGKMQRVPAAVVGCPDVAAFLDDERDDGLAALLGRQQQRRLAVPVAQVGQRPGAQQQLRALGGTRRRRQMQRRPPLRVQSAGEDVTFGEARVHQTSGRTGKLVAVLGVLQLYIFWLSSSPQCHQKSQISVEDALHHDLFMSSLYYV